MAKELGIQKIDMYLQMIDDRFSPIASEIRLRESEMKKAVEMSVRKDLGIYAITAEKEKIEKRLAEINSELELYEKCRHTSNGYCSKISEMADARMDMIRNGTAKKVKQMMSDLKDQVRLAGVGSDIREVFKALPAQLAKFEKEIKALPPISREIKKIETKKK